MYLRKLKINNFRKFQNLKVELEKRLEVLQKDSSSDGLNQLATELIIARWFAAKVQKDLGEV